MKTIAELLSSASAAPDDLLPVWSQEQDRTVALSVADLAAIFGTPSGFAPINPPQASELIAAAADAKTSCITLRQVLGTGYDVTQDAAAILNAVSTDIFAAGLRLVDPDGLTIRTYTTIRIVPGFSWTGPTKVRRAFASSGIANPTFGQYDLTSEVADVTIDGLDVGLAAENMSCIGAGFNFRVLRGRFRNIRLRTQNNNGGAGHGFLIRGTDVEVVGCYHSVAAGTGSGSMSYKVISGNNLRVLQCVGFPEDDCFGVVVNTSPTADVPNEGATNVLFADCYGETDAKLTVIGASSNPAGADNTYTGKIDGVTFRNIGGFGCYAAFKIEADNVASGRCVVDNVVVDNVGYAGTPATTQSAMYLTGAHIGTVGSVTIYDGFTKDPGRKRGLRHDAPGARVVLNGVHLIGTYNALYVRRAQGTISLRNGCVLETVPGSVGADGDDDGPEANMRSPIQVSSWKAYSWSANATPTGRLRLDLGSDTQIIGVATPTISGTPTAMPAINLVADTVDIVWPSGTVTPYSGATGNNLIRSGSSANTALLGTISSTLTGTEIDGSLTITRTDAGGGGGGATSWGSITGTLSSQSDLNTALNARELTANKASSNGYAGLDGSAKVPLAQLPAFVEASISTNTTVASTDHLKWYAATAALTLTLPTTPATGFTIRVSSASTVTVTLSPGGSDTVDRDNLVYPGEAVELVFTGSAWRRSILRGFGRDTTSSASVLPDLDSTTTPGGTYRATTSTTNIASRPSLLGTALIVRVSRQTSSVLSQEIWDPANLSLGSWMRTYTGGAWSLWTNGGAVAYVATASRPTNVLAGAQVFDTTLGRVVVWNGSAWADQSSPWSAITSKPTTLAGYGITDGLTTTAAAAAYQPIAAVLTATTASFTTTQQTKLSGIATGATANSADATLLARANHTGTQAASTITGLATVATSGLFADLGTKPTTLSGYGITDGRFPSPYLFPASTEWIVNGSPIGTSALVANGHLQGWWLCPFDFTIDQIGINVTAAGTAGATAKVTLYDSFSTDKINNLLFESPNMATDTTGIKTVALSASQAMVKGRLYWWGIRSSVAQTITAATGSNTNGMHLLTTPTSTNRTSVSRTTTYASGTQTPWVWSNSEYSALGMPMVFMRSV